MAINTYKERKNKLPTPIQPKILEKYLNEVDYNVELTRKLVKGFSHGFKLGYVGMPTSDPGVKNLSSCKMNKQAVDEHLKKEIGLGRIVGPFEKIPFSSFQLSPVGLVPKKSGKFRMIINLSAPEGHSINDGIPDHAAAVSYISLEDALAIIVETGKNCFLAKSDIQSAFRLLPLAAEESKLLCFEWEGLFYYDRCLPMGARSSCSLFESFSSAIEFIIKRKGVSEMVHYLDDFLFIHPTRQGCLGALNEFRRVCAEIGVPLAEDKTVGPSQKLEFLGFEIDTCSQIVSLPKEKLVKGKEIISALLSKNKCSLKDLQKLTGFLGFASTVVLPGRVYLNRFYAAMAKLRESWHHIRTTSVKEDLLVWKSFFDDWNGKSLYREQLFYTTQPVHIFTDASQILGCAAVFENDWLAKKWPSKWWASQNIFFLEMIPVWLAIEAWSTCLKNKLVVFHIDNWALVQTLNKLMSKDRKVMAVVRVFVMHCLKHNILVRAEHIAGADNRLADALSRGKQEEFFALHPQANVHPTDCRGLPTRWH